MLLTGGINLLQGAPASERLPRLPQLPPDQGGAADLRRRRGRALHPQGREASVPELAHFTTAKPFPNNPDTYEFGSKLFFEWSAKAEPYLKAAGLK